MLKFFYNLFLVSLLSGSLMLMDFSVKGIGLQSASAQAANSNNNQKAPPVAETTTEVLKTGVDDKSDIFATLAMTAVGTLASRLYKYKMTTDIMLAAAGGALFIGGEVVAFASLDAKLKEIESQITRDKNGNLNNEQIRHLERLKQSYEEAKKTAGTKKKLQMAAAAAFAAAGITAVTAAAAETAGTGACTSSITSAAATMPGICAALTLTPPLALDCATEVTACQGALGAYSTSFMAYELSRQALAPSSTLMSTVTAEDAAAKAKLTSMLGICFKYTKVQAGAVNISCGPPPVFKAINHAFTVAPGGVMSLNNKNMPTYYERYAHNISNKFSDLKNTENLFNKALNLFFPKAEAALFSAMGIMSSAATTYLLATSATLGIKMDFFMLTPQNRAYVWAALGVVTAAATTSTNSTMGKIQQNIDKIDAILNNIKGSTPLGNDTANVNAPTPKGEITKIKPLPNRVTVFKNEDVDLSKLTNGGVTLPCYTGADEKKCESFSTSIKAVPNYNSLDSLSQLELGKVFSVADGVNGTSKITAGTLAGAEGLGNNLNALKSSLANAQKTAMEKLKANGGKDESALLTKRFKDDLNDSVNAGLKKSNSTMDKMYSSMYSGGGSAGAASTANNTDVTKITEENTQILKGGGAPVTIDMGNIGSAGTSLGLGLGNDSAGGTPGDDSGAPGSDATAATSSMDEYDLKNDITKNSDSSIFELISNRYQKSGYPRLLKLKDPTAPAKN